MVKGFHIGEQSISVSLAEGTKSLKKLGQCNKGEILLQVIISYSRPIYNCCQNSPSTGQCQIWVNSLPNPMYQ